jgi:hypothetical protein
MKVTGVKYLTDYCINVSFDDGVSGIVNLENLVQKGIFKVLQDKTLFEKVYTTGYSIAWSEALEIDTTAIYLEITGKNWGDLYESRFSYATD